MRYLLPVGIRRKALEDMNGKFTWVIDETWLLSRPGGEILCSGRFDLICMPETALRSDKVDYTLVTGDPMRRQQAQGRETPFYSASYTRPCSQRGVRLAYYPEFQV
jgi:hypothetical protein